MRGSSQDTVLVAEIVQLWLGLIDQEKTRKTTAALLLCRKLDDQETIAG